MLVSNIKSLFFTELDEFQAAYFDNPRLTDVFFDAQTQVYKGLMKQYQLNNEITENLIPLTKKEVINPGSNTVNLTTALSVPYGRLITIKPTYTVSGQTYSYVAEQLLAEERNSVYAQGTIRYPRYEQYSDSNSEAICKLYPSTPVVNSVEVDFFRQPFTIDFDTPGDDIPYTNEVITTIVTKALEIAAAITREDGFFQKENILLTQNKEATR